MDSKRDPNEFLSFIDVKPSIQFPIPAPLPPNLKRAITFENESFGGEDEKIEVYVRLKPQDKNLEKDGMSSKSSSHILIDSESQISVKSGDENLFHRFSFSRIFDEFVTQSQFFQLLILPRLKAFLLHQESQLIFTYGATSSGKTHTIQGNENDPGILPRSLDLIFNSYSGKIKVEKGWKPFGFNDVERKGPGINFSEETQRVLSSGKMSGSSIESISLSSSASSTSSFLSIDKKDSNFISLPESLVKASVSIWISFAEIYNENIYDLLIDKGSQRGSLKLAEDKKGSVYIKGLQELFVSSSKEALSLLKLGIGNLQFSSTRLNHHSSRSHCIFTIKVLSVSGAESRLSSLSFCDLAGSERVKKTHLSGLRQKEASNINTSLLVLGRVLKALRENKSLLLKSSVVPYRDSKLTRLFQSFFTGSGKIAMIVNVSQSILLFDETIQVLKFGAFASKVVIQPGFVEKSKPKRSSRFSTLLLESQSLGGQGSIIWENPKIRSTLLPSSNLTFKNNEILGVSGVRNPLSSFSPPPPLPPLQKQIKDLEEELELEKKKNYSLEIELRKELCEEFNVLLESNNASWKKRLLTETERLEELSEWRIQTLELALQETRKRKRRKIDHEEEEEEENGEEEEEKKEEKKKAIDENQKMENVETCKETQMSFQYPSSSSSIQTFKESHDRVEEPQKSFLTLRKDDDALLLKKLKEDIQNLQRALTESETQSKALLETQLSKDHIIQDLRQLLDEASEEYLEKLEEISQYQTSLTEMKTALSTANCELKDKILESDILLAESTARLEDKEALEEDHIRILKENESLKKDFNDFKNLSESRVFQLEKDLLKLQSENVDKNKKCNSQHDVSLLETKEFEVTELLFAKQELISQIKSLKKNYEAQLNEAQLKFEKEFEDTKVLGLKIASQEERIHSLEMELKERSRKENETLLSFKESFSKQNKESFERLLEELKQKNEFLERSNEAKTYEIDKAVKEREKLLTHYSKTIKGLKDEVSRENVEVLRLQALLFKSTPPNSSDSESSFKNQYEVAKERIKSLEEELTLTKIAGEKILNEYRETNEELRRHTSESRDESKENDKIIEEKNESQNSNESKVKVTRNRPVRKIKKPLVESDVIQDECLTPLRKSSRKGLYSAEEKLEVFTPIHTDISLDSPHTMVKRQLRPRVNKK